MTKQQHERLPKASPSKVDKRGIFCRVLGCKSTGPHKYITTHLRRQHSLTKAEYVKNFLTPDNTEHNILAPDSPPRSLHKLVGSSSKLTRRPRGGGQQANFYSEGLKAK